MKTFSAVTTHVMTVCGKYHWNRSTKHKDITSRETGVNRQTADSGAIFS